METFEYDGIVYDVPTYDIDLLKPKASHCLYIDECYGVHVECMSIMCGTCLFCHNVCPSCTSSSVKKKAFIAYCLTKNIDILENFTSKRGNKLTKPMILASL